MLSNSKEQTVHSVLIIIHASRIIDVISHARCLNVDIGLDAREVWHP